MIFQNRVIEDNPMLILWEEEEEKRNLDGMKKAVFSKIFFSKMGRGTILRTLDLI